MARPDAPRTPEAPDDPDGSPDGPDAAAASDEGPEAPAVVPSSAYRPPFARDYPHDPELDRLLAAFVEGNYALVHEQAPELARRAADPAVARAARDLRRRLDPEPLALAMLAGTGLLLLFLVFWFYTHRH